MVAVGRSGWHPVPAASSHGRGRRVEQPAPGKALTESQFAASGR
jgi:hypothetical protein